MREIHINRKRGDILPDRRGLEAPFTGRHSTFARLLDKVTTGDPSSKHSKYYDLVFNIRKEAPQAWGADQQTHVIKAWLPHYSVHSAVSLEGGAWQVYDNFLIHDGPDYADVEDKYSYATIGCVEIMGFAGLSVSMT